MTNGWPVCPKCKRNRVEVSVMLCDPCREARFRKRLEQYERLLDSDRREANRLRARLNEVQNRASAMLSLVKDCEKKLGMPRR